MKIIGVAIQKGGVGKTTTAINLSAALAIKGKRILLVDTDPQAHVTLSLGFDVWNQPSTIYDVMVKGKPLNNIIKPTEIPGLDVVPSTYDLAGAEMELATRFGREYILRDELNQFSNYDYIIIDTPPSLGVLVANAIIASSLLIIPMQVEFLPMSGYAHLIKTLDLIATHLKHNPEQRILLTMYDGRTKTSRDVANEIREYFKEKVYKTVIPRNIDLSRAPSFGKTIFQYSPESSGAIAYSQLAEEIENV